MCAATAYERSAYHRTARPVDRCNQWYSQRVSFDCHCRARTTKDDVGYEKKERGENVRIVNPMKHALVASVGRNQLLEFYLG